MFKTKTRILFFIGLIVVALYIWSSNTESKARMVDAHLLRLGNYLSYAFPKGLPKELPFIDALHQSSKALKLGPVDPAGNNPLPDFLPQADYHYEKKINIENSQSPRVVCWATIPMLLEKQYFVLYSDWTEKVVWDVSLLPEFNN